MNRTLRALLTGTICLGLSLMGSLASARNLPQFTDLIDKVSPAVVNIRTTTSAGASASNRFQFPREIDPNDPFFEFFKRFLPPGSMPMPRNEEEPAQRNDGREIPRGQGSGFITSTDGYVITNHHVVAQSEKIYVTLSDGQEFPAELIGSDKRTDVAVLKIDGDDLPYLRTGKVSNVRAGEWVIAIGSPFGLKNTVTAGIVSAVARETGNYLPFIQTDVAINPGNSGGPLINMDGEVIGVNSQIYSRTGGYMGISFAIPIDQAMQIAEQLRSTGRVIRGRIGVAIGPVSKEVAQPLGLEDDVGVLVRNIQADGPAARADMQVGDIIVEFAGRKIEKVSDLPRLVGATKPGTETVIKVWRRGSFKTIAITVGELEPSLGEVAESGNTSGAEKTSVASQLGLTVRPLTGQKAKKMGVDSGVVVNDVDDPAKSMGIRPGDVLLAINNRSVESIEIFDAIVEELPKSKAAVLLIRRNDDAYYMPIKPR